MCAPLGLPLPDISGCRRCDRARGARRCHRVLGHTAVWRLPARLSFGVWPAEGLRRRAASCARPPSLWGWTRAPSHTARRTASVVLKVSGRELVEEAERPGEPENRARRRRGRHQVTAVAGCRRAVHCRTTSTHAQPRSRARRRPGVDWRARRPSVGLQLRVRLWQSIERQFVRPSRNSRSVTPAAAVAGSVRSHILPARDAPHLGRERAARDPACARPFRCEQAAGAGVLEPRPGLPPPPPGPRRCQAPLAAP